MSFSGYRLYLGSGSLGSVDFDLPVAEVDSAAASITLSGNLLDPASNYTFVLRSVLDDVESPDMSCVIGVYTNSESVPIQRSLAAAEALELFQQPSGEILVSWINHLVSVDANYEVRFHTERHCDLSVEADYILPATKVRQQSAKFSPPETGCWFVSLRGIDESGAVSKNVTAGPVLSENYSPSACRVMVSVV